MTWINGFNNGFVHLKTTVIRKRLKSLKSENTVYLDADLTDLRTKVAHENDCYQKTA